jgi:hypothetical protein
MVGIRGATITLADQTRGKAIDLRTDGSHVMF